VKRTLWAFDEKVEEGYVEEGPGIPNCANLLRAMELSDEEEETEPQGFDGIVKEMLYLPEEWVYNESGVTSLEDSNFTADDQAKKNDPLASDAQSEKYDLLADTADPKTEEDRQVNKKKEWGPIVVQRRSKRDLGGEKTILEKAQDIKRKWNEVPLKGMTKQTPLHITSDDLSRMAFVTGLVNRDGNPVDD
jgi:hypothetical protein